MTPFNCYALSFELAARELARHPETNNDFPSQYEICRKYGVFLDSLTNDEKKHLESLVEDFLNG